MSFIPAPPPPAPALPALLAEDLAQVRAALSASRKGDDRAAQDHLRALERTVAQRRATGASGRSGIPVLFLKGLLNEDLRPLRLLLWIVGERPFPEALKTLANARDAALLVKADKRNTAETPVRVQLSSAAVAKERCHFEMEGSPLSEESSGRAAFRALDAYPVHVLLMCAPASAEKSEPTVRAERIVVPRPAGSAVGLHQGDAFELAPDLSLSLRGLLDRPEQAQENGTDEDRSLRAERLMGASVGRGAETRPLIWESGLAWAWSLGKLRQEGLHNLKFRDGMFLNLAVRARMGSVAVDVLGASGRRIQGLPARTDGSTGSPARSATQRLWWLWPRASWSTPEWTVGRTRPPRTPSRASQSQLSAQEAESRRFQASLGFKSGSFFTSVPKYRNEQVSWTKTLTVGIGADLRWSDGSGGAISLVPEWHVFPWSAGDRGGHVVQLMGVFTHGF